MGRSEKSKEQQRKYDKVNTRMVAIKLNRRTDADILKWLEAKGNIQGYIKQVIRKDIDERGDEINLGEGEKTLDSMTDMC